ncbi:MAG: mechanosensitive ion channel family protein [Candidatus Eremiobacteraeota bacterium]|nr:mechanosensitive ion channel family protein [Candidatus Eremiobacteraeota bacterium]MCL5054372.1 mechanosensitive ion channel family protein [Bacillota bacterium]
MNLLLFPKMLPKSFSLNSIIAASVVLLIGYLVIHVMQKYFFKALSRHISEDKAGLIKFITRFALFSILILLILSILGINVSNIIFGATFLGAIIGLASQSLLANLFAGFMIFVTKLVKIGDRITLVTWQWSLQVPTYPHEAIKPGYTGTIKDINLYYTTLEEDNGLILKASNSILMQALITDYSEVQGRQLRIRFEMPRTDPFEQLKKELEDFLSNLDLIEQTPPPLIKIVDLSLNSYSVAVEIYTRQMKNEEEVKNAVLSFCSKRGLK